MKNEKIMNFILGAGIALVIISAATALLIGEFNLAAIIMAALGLAGIGLYIAVNFNKVKTIASNKGARQGTGTVVYSVIVISIIVLLQSILLTHSAKWDLTKNKKYTLSEQTKKVLKNMKADVEAYYFFSVKAQNPNITDIMEQYSKQSGKFKYQAVDADRNPSISARFKADRYGIVVLYRKDNNTQEKIDLLSEEGLTNGLIRITRDSRKKIYFTKGHGEPSLDAPMNDKTGYSAIKQELESYNYQVAAVELFTNAAGVPADCAVLVIGGPQTDLFDPEAAMINKYMASGGKVIVFEGPMVRLPKLDAMLAAKGIIPQNDIVVDKMGKMFGGDPLMPIINTYGVHDIVNPLRAAAFMPNCRTFAQKNNIAGIKLTELAMTNPGSWGETDIASVRKGEVSQTGSDLKAPLPAAIVSQADYSAYIEPGATAKPGIISEVVVFGSSDFINNTFLGASANKDLVLNAFNYMAGQGDTISIKPKDPSFEPLFLSKMGGRMLFIIPVIFLPLLCVSLGILVFVRRRRS